MRQSARAPRVGEHGRPAPSAIHLKPGEQLGPYKIDAQIGAGGMGEVYRARDTRLNRDVAIKVSAEKFVTATMSVGSVSIKDTSLFSFSSMARP